MKLCLVLGLHTVRANMLLAARLACGQQQIGIESPQVAIAGPAPAEELVGRRDVLAALRAGRPSAGSV